MYKFRQADVKMFRTNKKFAIAYKIWGAENRSISNKSVIFQGDIK